MMYAKCQNKTIVDLVIDSPPIRVVQGTLMYPAGNHGKTPLMFGGQNP